MDIYLPQLSYFSCLFWSDVVKLLHSPFCLSTISSNFINKPTVWKPLPSYSLFKRGSMLPFHRMVICSTLFACLILVCFVRLFISWVKSHSSIIQQPRYVYVFTLSTISPLMLISVIFYLFFIFGDNYPSVFLIFNDIYGLLPLIRYPLCLLLVAFYIVNDDSITLCSVFEYLWIDLF